jgi:hypothetical protein
MSKPWRACALIVQESEGPMLFGVEWFQYVIGIETGIILAMLPHVIWPMHRNPFALGKKEGEKRGH